MPARLCPASRPSAPLTTATAGGHSVGTHRATTARWQAYGYGCGRVPRTIDIKRERHTDTPPCTVGAPCPSHCTRTVARAPLARHCSHVFRLANNAGMPAGARLAASSRATGSKPRQCARLAVSPRARFHRTSSVRVRVCVATRGDRRAEAPARAARVRLRERVLLAGCGLGRAARRLLRPQQLAELGAHSGQGGARAFHALQEAEFRRIKLQRQEVFFLFGGAGGCLVVHRVRAAARARECAAGRAQR